MLPAVSIKERVVQEFAVQLLPELQKAYPSWPVLVALEYELAHSPFFSFNREQFYKIGIWRGLVAQSGLLERDYVACIADAYPVSLEEEAKTLKTEGVTFHSVKKDREIEYRPIFRAMTSGPLEMAYAAGRPDDVCLLLARGYGLHLIGDKKYLYLNGTYNGSVNAINPNGICSISRKLFAARRDAWNHLYICKKVPAPVVRLIASFSNHAREYKIIEGVWGILSII